MTAQSSTQPPGRGQKLSAREAFRKHFDAEPTLMVSAPGRVNLIGEHTDYNEGFVFPAAIDRAMTIRARPTSGSTVRIFSLDYDEADSFSLDKIEKGEKVWSNYLRGVVATFKEAGHQFSAFDAVLSGNVPQGAGLSSSAAYEVAVATLLNIIGDLKLDGKQIAILSQRAENQFIGVQCGIMDQFISALAQSDSALLIDCRSLSYRSVKLNLDKLDLAIVITNSGVSRGLVDSQYNARRSECEEGVTQLGINLKRTIHSLRDISLDELSKYADVLSETVAKRCRHVISENERVIAAVDKLERKDMLGFGQLMNLSHKSLRDDYQVSCAELDALVELTQKHTGTIGARMTGAGFGGCSVAIMKMDSVRDFVASVVPKYERTTGRKAEVYVCRAVSGATV